MNANYPPDNSGSTTETDSTAVHRIVASVWDNHRNQDYRKDISHWRGHGRWQNIDVWKKMGEKNLSDLRILLHFLGKSTDLSRQYSVLEWGPGGGANLLAMRSIANKLYAVDISQRNLNESGRILAEVNYDSYHPILLAGKISSALDSVEGHLDIVLSTAVFQHFPSKEYGVEVLNVLSSKMKRGSAGIIQIRYDNGNPNFKPKSIQQYESDHITATSYPLDDFWNELSFAGFEPLFIRDLNSTVNYATFWFYKR